MQTYNHIKIENKWQKVWEEKKSFSVENIHHDKENAYILIEFPYPSGKGLHVGHIRSYTAFDIVARQKRLQGKNVLFPMGIDAFGLEAERTAIREKKLPQEIVERNTKTFVEQLKTIGLSFDWDRFISTSDPNYFKWTQWLFLQFFKNGLAYKGEMMVNWCSECGVLANEETENGKCCQCKRDVVQKPKSQWLLKMTDYAERLEDDLEQTDYLEHIKLSQKNWIGKSEGVEVEFAIKQGGSFRIFTTCIETIFGITFMVLAPESPIVAELKKYISNVADVNAYIAATSKKSEFERRELIKEKSGCKLDGVTAINPVNNAEVDIYIGDFVLAGYGTGAVMAVPAHDERDYEFAEKYGIDIVEVISGGDISKSAYVKEDYLPANARLVNSGEFSGQTVWEAKESITSMLVKKGVAEKKINFKMRDWVFSRQRYWGEPIPIVHCQSCGHVPLPESDLPLMLPEVDSYEPTRDGESPLSAVEEWVNTTCPKCGGYARRETDTMPGWAGSSWYFLRYCDPKNDKEFASVESLKAWLPVEIYNGGNEHTTRHLMYARFWMKALFDMGLVPSSEPFKKRVSQGLILGSNGVKMSKSLGNVVDPRDVVAEYGADSLRLWEMFIGDYQETVNWNDDGVKACNKVLTRIWNAREFLVEEDEKNSPLFSLLHQTIKKVTQDIDALKFNTAVSAIIILVNEIYRLKRVSADVYSTLITLISPFAPHIANELFEICGFGSLDDASWPTWDEAALVTDSVEIPVQINGKMKGKVVVASEASEEEIVNVVVSEFADLFSDKTIVKTIYVKHKIINLIVKWW